MPPLADLLRTTFHACLMTVSLCAATASPYQEQATKNLAAIKAGK